LDLHRYRGYGLAKVSLAERLALLEQVVAQLRLPPTWLPLATLNSSVRAGLIGGRWPLNSPGLSGHPHLLGRDLRLGHTQEAWLTFDWDNLNRP
jgi:hypothetical protein